MNGQGELVQDVNSVHLWGGSLEILGVFLSLYVLKKTPNSIKFQNEKRAISFLAIFASPISSPYLILYSTPHSSISP